MEIKDKLVGVNYKKYFVYLIIINLLLPYFAFSASSLTVTPDNDGYFNSASATGTLKLNFSETGKTFLEIDSVQR